MDKLTIHLSREMLQTILTHIDGTMVHRHAAPILGEISRQVREQTEVQAPDNRPNVMKRATAEKVPEE